MDDDDEAARPVRCGRGDCSACELMGGGRATAAGTRGEGG